jgi:hypothetical protein
MQVHYTSLLHLAADLKLTVAIANTILSLLLTQYFWSRLGNNDYFDGIRRINNDSSVFAKSNHSRNGLLQPDSSKYINFTDSLHLLITYHIEVTAILRAQLSQRTRVTLRLAGRRLSCARGCQHIINKVIVSRGLKLTDRTAYWICNGDCINAQHMNIQWRLD